MKMMLMMRRGFRINSACSSYICKPAFCFSICYLILIRLALSSSIKDYNPISGTLLTNNTVIEAVKVAEMDSNGPEMDPKWTRNGPGTDSEWILEEIEMEPGGNRVGPRVDLECIQQGNRSDI